MLPDDLSNVTDIQLIAEIRELRSTLEQLQYEASEKSQWSIGDDYFSSDLHEELNRLATEWVKRGLGYATTDIWTAI